MNKKYIVSAILISLGMSSAYAGLNTPIGSGSIDGTVNKVANIPLTPLLDISFPYDIHCKVTDATGSRAPAVVRFEPPTGPFGMVIYAEFDDVRLSSNQAKLKDSNEHNFSISGITGSSLNRDAAISLTWVAGDDAITPISYACYITPTVGLKK